MIDLPDHFGMVTSANEPLIVDTTPYSADSTGLAVTERSVNRLVVEELNGGTGSYEFAYTVAGTRKGYEDKEVVQEPDDRKRKDLDERQTRREVALEEGGQPSESADGSR